MKDGDNSYRATSHATFQLRYHLVLVTKYRRKCLTKNMIEFIKENAAQILRNQGCILEELNGEADHVHILFSSVPSVRLSDLVALLKSRLSRKTRQKFAEHLSKYYWKPFLWSRSYFITTTGGATVEIIRGYIERQGRK